MGELFGWSAIRLEPGEAELRARRMGDALQMARGRAPHAVATIPTCLGRDSAAAGASVAGVADDVCAVIEGDPQWVQDDLAAIASAEGHAAALLAAFRQYGIELIAQLRGSFALAILAPAQRLALLAVDRFGIRPLCYRTVGGGCVFGSDVDAVRAFSSEPLAVDPQSVFDYCYFHVVPSPASIFRDIRKLEPAQMVVLREGRIESRRYWLPQFFNGGPAPDRAGLEAALRETVRAAVSRSRPGADSACFLSGGCDSSTVAGMVQSLQSTPARTYSIGFAEAGYDESQYARAVVEHFSLHGTEVKMTARDVEELVPAIVGAYDEPFANSSAAPTLFCAQAAARDGVRHMLAGDGGDELFAGNERYAKQRMFELYFNVPAPVRAGVERFLERATPLHGIGAVRKVASYVQQANVPMPRRMDSYNFLNRTPAETVFDAEFLAAVDREHPLRMLSEHYAEPAGADMLDQMLYLDWKITLADNDLRKVNRMCELAGVRVSYPLLDDAVVELSTRVPPRWKMRGFRLRHFYKASFSGFLPRKVITKKKHGFGLPVGEWLRGSRRLNEMALDSLTSLRGRGVFRDTFVDELVAAHRTGDAGYFGKMIWVLMMFELWMQSRGFAPGRRIF